MHLKRWITGLAALPFLFALLYWGGPGLFTVVIAAVAAIALWEYFRIVTGDAATAIPWALSGLAYLLSAVIMWAAYRQDFAAILIVVTLNLLIGGIVSIRYFGLQHGITGGLFKQVLGLVYVPLLLAHLVLLRLETQGALWIFLLLAVVFAGDIGALYVGTFLGRHKLCPAVSPNKTIEGALGGMAANMALVALFKITVFPLLGWGRCLLFALLVGAAGQLGDLFESVLKRGAGVKDSGRILPGHGGLLDRLDALMFAAPVAYYLKLYLWGG